jgi:uncharacterized protein (TIGR03083 family)
MPGPRVAALVARLEKGQRKTEEILSTLDDEQWGRVVYTEPYVWTARDLLAHFFSAETELLLLVQNVAAGGPGAPEGYDFDRYNADEHRRLATEPPANLLAALAESRRKTIEWAQSLQDDDLDRIGRHPALGEVTLEILITAMYGHVLLHMRDAQRALS